MRRGPTAAGDVDDQHDLALVGSQIDVLAIDRLHHARQRQIGAARAGEDGRQRTDGAQREQHNLHHRLILSETCQGTTGPASRISLPASAA